MKTQFAVHVAYQAFDGRHVEVKVKVKYRFLCEFVYVSHNNRLILVYLDSGVRYQVKTDRLPVSRSLRPGYEVLI